MNDKLEAIMKQTNTLLINDAIQVRCRPTLRPEMSGDDVTLAVLFNVQCPAKTANNIVKQIGFSDCSG